MCDFKAEVFNCQGTTLPPTSSLSITEGILKASCGGCGAQMEVDWISGLPTGVEESYPGECLDPYQVLHDWEKYTLVVLSH